MERKPNESFEAYKTRRAAANLAVKQINYQARNDGSSTREQLRREQRGGGTYGKNLLASFARQRATPALLAKHKQHLEHMAARKAAQPLPLAA